MLKCKLCDEKVEDADDHMLSVHPDKVDECLDEYQSDAVDDAVEMHIEEVPDPVQVTEPEAEPED